jgi:transposase-like protein
VNLPLLRAPEQVERELERSYVDDHGSVSEIARRLGRRDQRTVLMRAEIPFRHRTLPAAAELARLYMEERLSTRGIAHRFGVSQARVWRALAAAGVPRRASRGGPAPLAGFPRRRLG